MKRFYFSRRHRKLLLAGITVIAAAVFLYFPAQLGLGIPCLFYQITGLQCPGCGNSRVVLALLRLDIPAALGYNLLFPVEFFYIGWVLFHCCKSYLKGNAFAYKPPCLWLDICALVAVLLWWLLRNLL